MIPTVKIMELFLSSISYGYFENSATTRFEAKLMLTYRFSILVGSRLLIIIPYEK